MKKSLVLIIAGLFLCACSSEKKKDNILQNTFPQFKHFGHSNISKFYGLSGTEEAAAYLASNDVFARVLDKYFRGQRDNWTIRIIKGAEKTT